MAVDPTKPGNIDKGQDFQDFQRLRRALTAPAPKAPPPLPLPEIRYPTFPIDSYPRPDPFPPSAPYPSSVFPHSTIHRPVSPGFGETIAQTSSEIANQTVEHVWPLRAGVRLAECFAGAGPGVRIPLALLCTLAAVGLAGSVGWTGSALLFALAAGSFFGWALPTVLAILLALTTYLTGLLIGVLVRLALLAAIILVIFFVFKAMA